ncbi:TPA: hypothetical protein L4559_005174 [Pseudomonas aeruginosa]|nr:hypothetical protein [Pseudomonas aeruginosa]
MSTIDSSRYISVYEAGRAIVTILQGSALTESVTLQDRLQKPGKSMPKAGRPFFIKSQLDKCLQERLAGRAAEKLMLNDFSSHGADDLNKASELAVLMTAELGMGSSGRATTEALRPAGYEASGLVRSVNSMLTIAEDQAFRLLEPHRELVGQVADLLLAKEELSVEEITSLVTQAIEHSGQGE